MTTLLVFFWGGFQATTPPVTSRPFYRPQGIDVADERRGRVDVADERRIAGDEQVQ